MKKIIFSILFLLLLPLVSQADYSRCVELGDSIDLYVQWTDTTGAAATATSREALIVDSAQATDTTISDGSFTNVASKTGFDVVTFTVGAGDPVGTWAVHWEGTVGGVVSPGIDYIEVLNTDECVGGYLGATAHTNLVNQYDGTGITGDTFPATQQQLSNIALTGAAVSTPAKDAPNGFVITSGENEANDEDSTHALDDVTHDLEAVNDGGTEKIEAYYEFAIGGNGVPTGVTVHQYLDKGGGQNKNLTVWAYNWGGTTWDQIGTLTSGTSLETDVYTLFTSHVGTGGNIGLVRIRYLTGSVSLSATSKLLVDQIFAEYAVVNNTVGYAEGAIWIDTNASNTKTESFVDGTADNPVSTWAAALTISGNLNITRFHIANGSAITLTGNSDNYWIAGQGYTLALNGQSIALAYIFGGTVTGIGPGGGTVFEDTPIGDVTLAPSIMRRAFLFGTITNSGTGDWFINHSMSRIAGTSTPVFDFGTSVGDTNLNMRGYSGGIQLESMGDTGTDTASIEGWGQVVEGTNTAGTVTIRGNFTTSGITNLTLSDDARIDVAQINAEADTALTDYAPIKLTDTVDGTITVQEVLCALSATQLGKSSGMGTTTVTFRNIDDDTDVVVGTQDSSYNRTSVTLTLTGCN